MVCLVACALFHIHMYVHYILSEFLFYHSHVFCWGGSALAKLQKPDCEQPNRDLPRMYISFSETAGLEAIAALRCKVCMRRASEVLPVTWRSARPGCLHG